MTQSAPLLLIHVLFLSLLPLTITSSPTIEAECLLKWKNSLISSLSLNSSWSLTNIGNLCNWTGIACDTTGSVSEINLSETELEGTLAKFDFSSFPGLTDFNLGTNKLNGSLPSMIGGLTELQYLSFYNNCLVGTIPYQITNLQKICFNYNKLASEFPGFTTDCRNLTYHDLAQNQLTDAIPESAFQPPKPSPRKKPIQWSNSCRNPCELTLWVIPSSFTNLSKISELGLSGNFLSGKISPYLITNWTELISLQVKSNSFTGEIPSEIGLLEKLNYLFLYDNGFYGSIPSEIGNLKEFGTVPPEIGNLTSLTVLDLSTNKLHGELPETLSLLNKLETLSAFANNFLGTIPTELGENSPNLMNVSFANNRFSGELPPGLCNGFALQHLTVNEGNNFTGPLLECLMNCTRLFPVRLEGNQFTGDISEAFGVHPSLNFISLSGN
ncbi:MDIS1-interacting receptor like kinase 2 [Vitis vinifera]|uniref:MDIS1-interacting receptor like kinase 2 n=1 Tax=Vitis vinifera TaxID=29760 RepID=A0A438KDM4_VITVI|nr:MDIS1-interacting receptor like kinase 2 [Vitis vinifera]